MELAFRERCYGGQPKSKEVYEAWANAKGEHPREPLDEKLRVLHLEDKETESENDLREETELAWTGFRSDSNGIYLRDFMVEAMIKQCGTTLGIFTKKRGSKGITQHGLHVHPREIHFTNKLEADASEVIAGHVSTAQGKRDILKKVDYVEDAILAFQIKLLLGQSKLSEKDLFRMFHLAQENGLGACRSRGGGKFDVVKMDEAADVIIG